MKKISIDNLSTNFEKYMNKVMNDNEVYDWLMESKKQLEKLFQ